MGLIPEIINLKRILDKRGNLSVIEQFTDIPFEIKRAYWIYDVPGGEDRDGHAYRRGEEFIVALSGSFDIIVDDGLKETKYSLNRSYYGLYIPPGYWRTLANFSTNSLALLLSSTLYEESDYILDRNEFKELRLTKQDT